jgi:CDP-diacylglycerol--glycerol-3-phosphate 3-phosphatidyltransferase
MSGLLAPTLDRCYRLLATRVKEPGGDLLVRAGLSANRLTLLGLALSIAAGIVVALTGQLGPAALLFLIGSLADLFDGAVARRTGTATSSRLGGWLDTFSDKVGELALLAGLMFAFTDPFAIRLAGLTALTSLLVGFAKAAAGEYQIRPNWVEVQLLGRPGRVVILVGGLALSSWTSQPLTTVVAPLALLLVGFNLPILAHRVVKVVRTARS